MNNVMMALAIASVMLCIGMLCRAKIKFLQKMLVPVSVIAGVLGFIFMNTAGIKLNIGTNVTAFSEIVNVMFALSFISIGLTGGKKRKEKEKTGKQDKKEKGQKSSGMVRGAIGMGLIWCLLYALTAAVGVLIIQFVGKGVGMKPIYGILIPFAFCQGPGQASTYGRIFEQTYGFQNAEMVALTFAIVGFLAAFLFGVPLAKYGLKKGLAKNNYKISKSVEKGYYTPQEQRESLGKVTTHSANIETVTIHFALMGVCYLIALGLAKIVTFVPVLGPTFGAMLFFWGMIAAYIVKAVLRKMKVEYLLNDALQGRVTGWLSDYLVVCAFMAIQVGVIGTWLIPILIECAICAVITFLVCVYFGSRLGGDHDFERVLGLYGTSTGTTPSGVALVRMVDPRLATSTTNELGMMNLAMMFSTPTMLLITLAGIGTVSLPIAVGGILATVILYMVLLKVFGVWRKKPSFSLRKGILDTSEDGEEKKSVAFVQGFLREETYDSAGLVK